MEKIASANVVYMFVAKVCESVTKETSDVADKCIKLLHQGKLKFNLKVGTALPHPVSVVCLCHLRQPHTTDNQQDCRHELLHGVRT